MACGASSTGTRPWGPERSRQSGDQAFAKPGSTNASRKRPTARLPQGRTSALERVGVGVCILRAISCLARGMDAQEGTHRRAKSFSLGVSPWSEG